ncbi:hypothetical protein SD457_13395 [Coprobacillaceae bacterium CR2/5/TPMF4]|nr:hypothetical protein SD457_13395 [Coprobacillaceae bacterium CR2/5/TPMF4]
MDIDKLVLSLAIGNYTPAYVVSKTIKYLYDLNIYTMNNKWTLEVRSQSEVLSCIEKLKEKDLRIDDPAGVYNIISTMDRLEVEKYFIRHSKQLERNVILIVFGHLKIILMIKKYGLNGHTLFLFYIKCFL